MTGLSSHGWLAFAFQVCLFQDGLFPLLTLGGAFLNSGRLAPAAVGMLSEVSCPQPNSEHAWFQLCSPGPKGHRGHLW